MISDDATLRTVPVNIPGFEYSVLVRVGVLADAGTLMKRLTRSRKVAVVTDSNVGPLHADKLEGPIRAAGFEVVRATVPAGEDHKTLRDVEAIFDQLLSAGLERTTPILALGGGVVGDMAGFVAATALRGVPFVQVPTTLLAMVDASVGGKTGVNHKVGKNLIGAFHQPKEVIIDPSVLTTLPDRELRGGLAECIKHDVIRDAAGFAKLEEHLPRALAKDVAYLAELVAHNVAIKADVVESDPYEHGERAHLNFGHTYGHAIEGVSGYAYSHGEAVGLGMVAAAQLAADLGMIDAATRDRIAALIARAGLPTRGVTLDLDAVQEAMSFDKKVAGGRLRLILPTRLGQVVIRDDVPADAVRAAMETLR